MTYDQILTLDLIVKYGSFKAASDAMHKTQPSLSMAIKKLEDEFGIELFNRDGYRPVLTEQGKAFHKKSQSALNKFKELEKLGQELGAGFESEISICMDAIFPICHISHVFEKFFEPHITTTLNLSTDVIDGVISKLINHEVDFVLGPNFGLPDHIEKIKIMEVTIVPVIGKKHFSSGKVTKELLESLPQIVVGSSVKEKKGIVRGAISDQFWYTTDFSMKEQLIESGLGWGRLPLHQVEDKIKSGSLLEIKNLSDVIIEPVGMYLLRSKNKIMGPNTKNLWKYLAQLGENL
ncbi:MAG: DNA-binding transcriptional LysR family regulator [Bacteriovoracaceae bacterium]|jgi:DNA-binding transcriptional LysR family regulator